LVTVHAEKSTLDDVAASGVDSLAHWTITWPLDTETVVPRSLLETLVQNGTPVVSTFNLVRPRPQDLRTFHDLGGVIAMGTDALGTGSVERYSRELIQMVTYGMTPMEAIVASTANAAYTIGLEDRVGTLEPGKLADIIILPSNPLDDIQAIQDDIIYVIRGGEVVFPRSK
jgi:imidazolonepropionase-like amidohydrolase